MRDSCQDRLLVERTAADMIRSLGRAAAAFVREQKEISEQQGDRLSAAAWCDIANAIDQLLKPLRDPTILAAAWIIATALA